MVEGLRAAGVDDVPVVVGGIIPPDDAAELQKRGVAAVFTPKDYRLTEMMDAIVTLVRAAQGLAAIALTRGSAVPAVAQPGAFAYGAAFAGAGCGARRAPAGGCRDGGATTHAGGARAVQAVRRGRRAGGRRPRRPPRRGRRDRRGERRGQVHAGQRIVRDVPGRRGGRSSLDGVRVRIDSPAGPGRSASRRCSRGSRCARTSTSSRTCSSAARSGRSGWTSGPWNASPRSCCGRSSRRSPGSATAWATSRADSGRPSRSPGRCSATRRS